MSDITNITPATTSIELPDEQYKLTFDWKRPLLHANQTLHWGAEHKLKREARTAVAWRAKSRRIPPLGRIHVELTWVVKDNHRRDSDNLGPLLKPMIDGLVDAKVVVDDRHELVSSETHIRVDREAKAAHFELLITRLPE